MITLIFIIWRSILLIVAQMSALVILPKSDFLGKGFAINLLDRPLWTWANFDGEHYLWIANYWYRPLEYAFFPLYPLLIKVLGFVINDYLIAGLIISNVSLVVLLYILYQLFIIDYSKKSVIKGILLLLVFPTGFYLGSVYNESLFLSLAFGAILLARRNMFKWASLLVVLASLTRLIGVLLVPLLLMLWYQSKKTKKDLFFIALSLIGFILVLAFNYYSTQDALSFVHSQKYFGANRTTDTLILLPQVIVRYIKIFFTVNPFSHAFYVAGQEFLLTLIFIIYTLIYRKNLRLEYFLFSFLAIIIPTLTGTFSSMPRYLLAATPLFFSMGDTIANKYLFLGVVVIFVVLQSINIVLFTNGYWVS